MKLLYTLLTLMLLQAAEAHEARPQRVRRRRELVRIQEDAAVPNLDKLDNTELIARLLQDGSMSM
jgi:hypothetical protein